MKEKIRSGCRIIAAVLLNLMLVSVTAGCSNLYNDILDKKKLLLFPRPGHGNGLVQKNAVGPTKSKTLRTLDFTPSNNNAVFIAKSGNDTSGNGTVEHPYLTIKKAITDCNAMRQAVVIMDSGIYEEKGFEFTGNFRKLVAALGKAPVVRLLVNTDYVEAGDTIVNETIFNITSTSQVRTGKLPNDSCVIAYSEGDGRFLIVNNSGQIIVPEKIFEAGSVEHKSISVLSNNNFFISWGNQFVIYDNNGVLLKEKAPFTASGLRNESVTLGNDNVVLAVQNSTGILKFKIFDKNGIELVPEKTVSEKSTNGISLFSLSRFSNDNFVISYFCSRKGYFKIYNKSGNVVVPETEFDSLFSNGYSTRTDVFTDDCFVIVYTASDNNACFSIWSPDGENVVAKNTFITGSAGQGQYDVNVIQGNMFVISISRLSDNKAVYFVYDREGTSVLDGIVFNESEVLGINTEIFNNGNALIAYRKSSGYLTIRNLFHAPAIRVSADSAVNGIKFDAGSSQAYDSLFQCDAAFSAQWCDMTGLLIYPNTFTGSVLLSNSPLIIKNSRIYDNSNGVNVSSGYVTITDSLLFRNTSDYAFHINGSAAAPGDITIDHCDFFNNQGGLRLEGNSGNEVVKNSIFHDNTDNAVNADTAVTVAHSIVTGAVHNMILGESLLGSDPLYINEGASDPDDIDLNLRFLLGGFPVDSPAMGLGDDGRNAGAYDVEYVND